MTHAPTSPLRGLRTPKEKNPTRVVLEDEEYRALLEVSHRVDWRFHVALVLAHETGHRIGAIRQLRWSDIDFEDRTILWRAAHEKPEGKVSRNVVQSLRCPVSRQPTKANHATTSNAQHPFHNPTPLHNQRRPAPASIRLRNAVTSF